ncbi:MAG TPA: acyl-CoA thioesterase, partial [Alphaproteobacteria bacterium]|nr:acyl-CoA thioesterase [Alphaproteobacteria bacterium]
CDFFRPSRMGEKLTYTLLVRGIGRSSLRLEIVGHVGAQERLRARLVLVVISLETQRSVPIPSLFRERFAAYQQASESWQLPASA